MKKFFLSEKFRSADLIVLITLCVLSYLAFNIRMSFSDAINKTSDISLGYIARENNGVYYVIDDGHSRVLSFNDESDILLSTYDLSDNGESMLYIDDMYAADDYFYISASEWDGMILSREVIARFDLKGNYLDTIFQNDYSFKITNKHRFYGLCEYEGSFYFAETKDDAIVFHELADGINNETRIAYPNAFNAVSDVVFDNGVPVVMNKNGKIERFDDPRNPTLVYDASWEEKENRVPFRVAVNNGEVYFTDVRHGVIVKADTENQKSIYVCDTSSQTVSFSNDGKDMLRVDEDGLKVSGEEEKSFLTLNKDEDEVKMQYAFLGFCAVGTVLALIIAFRIIIIFLHNTHNQTTIISALVVLAVALVCIAISVLLLSSFRNLYREKIKEQLESTAVVVASSISEEELDAINTCADFESEAYKNLCTTMENNFPLTIDFYKTTYCNILRLDESEEFGYAVAYLDQSIGTYFPLDEIETEEVYRVYTTGEDVWNDAVADVSGTYLSVKVPVADYRGKVYAAIAVGADTFVVEEMISGMQKRVLLSIVIIVLLIWIVSGEIISFFSNSAAYLKRKEEVGIKAVPVHMFRILIFLVFATFNLVSSFLPVYILRRCEAFAEVNRTLLASLPMTVNIFVMGIMSLFCAQAVRKIGIKKVFMIATFLSMCGNALMAFLPGYASVIIGLFLDGIGVGLISNAIYVVITYLENDEDRQNGLTSYNAASLSGINFGMILGGLLATGIGQRYVFLVVALTWLFLLFFGARLSSKLEESTKSVNLESADNKSLSVFEFIKHKSIWTFIVMIQNPYIIFNSFVFYFVPIFCEEIGYNETIVSLFLMLYSEVAVMLSDYLCNQTQKSLGNYSIYLAIALNIFAVGFFTINGTVVSLLIALVILGVGASFGKPSHQTYFLNRKATQDYGEDKAMGLYNFSENIGESLGPIVFGRLIGAAQSVTFGFLTFIGALSITHYIFNGKELNQK